MYDPRDIIIRPIVSEKTYAMIEQNRYTFEVAKTANKTQIGQAISEIFNVTVTDVNTMNVETTARLSIFQEETVSSFAWQLLAGLNFELVPGLSADFTYRYFGTNPHLAIVDLKYRASILSAGINFHF